MFSRRMLILVCTGLTAALAAPHPAAALERRFVEEFSSRALCDTSLTTAEWDTVAGELRLPAFAITELGSWNTTGTAYGVDASGDHVYVADWAGGLAVIDVSDPAAPALTGTCALAGSAFGVAAAGDLAYVAVQAAGLQIVDISDPASPTVAGGYDTAGSAYAVLHAGDLVYVADGFSGLAIVDVSNPASPSLVGACDTPGKAYGVALHGSYALVADSESGMQVIDVTDPALPAIVGSYDTGGYAWDVAVAGDAAFVSDNSGGLVVLDVSIPASPSSLAVLALPGPALGSYLDGDRLQVGCGPAGLAVIDVSDPGNPVVTGTYNTSGSAYDVDVAGEYALVADAAAGLRILDLRMAADLSRMDLVDRLGDCAAIAMAGDVAWVVDQGYGLRAVDVSDPLDMVEIGDVAVPGDLRSIAVHGDHAFLGDYSDDLMVVDISVPASPAFVDSFSLPGHAYDVVRSGSLLYMACDAAGVQIVDVGDPAAPSTVGSYVAAGKCRTLAIDGNLLAVGLVDGFELLDVTDPTAPAHLGSGGWSSLECTSLGLDGDLLCAGLGPGMLGSYLLVYDVADPSAPAELRTLGVDTVSDLQIAGDLVFVATEGSVRAFDITDPNNVVSAGATATLPRGSLALAGDVLYTTGADELASAWVFTDRYRIDRNMAFSTIVLDHDDTIAALRLSTEQSGSPITWRALMDGAIAEIHLTAGAGYRFLDGSYRGQALQWYAVLDYGPFWGEAGPVCTGLELEWLFDYAVVDSVVDVPDDQGGWVRIHFTPSGWDLDGSDDPVQGYNVLRRIDDVQTLKAIAADDGRRLASDAALAGSLPPGSWEVLGYFGAWEAEQYTYLAPTLGDSGGVADPSVFCIMARTAGNVFHVSPPDSGWSVDNLAPNVPEGLMVAYASGGNSLEWLESEAEDFRYFKVYRGTTPDFVIDPENPVQVTTSPSWTDPAGGFDVFYKVSAVDFAGNESAAALPGGLTGIGTTPSVFRLLGASPNPFNPKTTIRFDLPDARCVDLRVYDATGRLVRTLLDGETRPAGRQDVAWDGRDAAGRTAPSGVYFYSLRAGEDRDLGRMLLLK